MFFFSSRRRHTRYWRDWSSDVCSSDLSWVLRQSCSDSYAAWSTKEPCSSTTASAPGGIRCSTRLSRKSVERRVGKECKSWRWPYHLKQDLTQFYQPRPTGHHARQVNTL